MARFTDVDVFLAVADIGSFRGAATRLSITRSTVSRAVARLEAHLGTPLFLRDTATVRLTDAGAAYKRGARRAAAALTQAERDAKAVTGEISGTIRLTAPRAFGPVATRCVTRFLAEHRDIQIDLLLTDRMVNPILDDVDIAMRTGSRLADSDLKSRKLVDLAMIAVASPEIAEIVTTSDTPVPAVSFVRPSGEVWRYSGAPRPLALKLTVNDFHALKQAVLEGLGVGVISRGLVLDELVAGRLVQVLPSWRLPTGKIWAVYPARGLQPLKLRRMMDALVEGFSAELTAELPAP